jgi:hypothetical protein
MERPDRSKQADDARVIEPPVDVLDEETESIPRPGQQALGGNDIDQSRRGATVDEGMLTKGERRRGGQDVS